MQIYLRLLHYMRPYWGRLLAAGVCSGIVAGLTGGYAWLVKPALDEVFINKNVTWLMLLPVALLLVSLLKGLAAYGQTYLMIYVGSRVVMVVPPADGYGAAGSPPKISGTDTLVFVVDILAAY